MSIRHRGNSYLEYRPSSPLDEVLDVMQQDSDSTFPLQDAGALIEAAAGCARLCDPLCRDTGL